MPRVACAAVRFRETIYSLPAPARHHDVIRHICETQAVETVVATDEDQGFLDDAGRYITRRQALGMAQRAGQLKEGALGLRLGRLYSEDVW